MANYSLVIGSKYSPFTFDELLKPALLATQAHRELEDQYSELGIKANSWEDLINEQVDAELHGKVSQYSKDLKSQADLLASQGLTPTTRKELLAMKNRYSKDITPIELAYNKREELAKEQREALLKDPSLIFDTDYSTASLKSIMNNPSASFNPISGKEITKRAATMAKEAANIIMSDPEYSSVFGGQYVQQKINQGYTVEQVIAAAQRDPNAPKALLGIVDSIKEEVGYDNWNDENKAKIDSYINEGLNSAVGTPKIDVMANKGYVNPLDREREELQEELIRAQIEEAKGTDLPGGGKVIKLGGGKFVQYDANGNIVLTNTSFDSDKETTEEKEEAKLRAKATVDHEVALTQARKVSDITELGYTPMIAVVKDNGSWNYGEQRDDFPRSGWGTKSNLGTSWGKYSLYPKDENAETSIVSLDQIPGFEVFKSEGILEDNSAWESLFNMGLEKGLIKTETIKHSELEKGMVQVSQPRQEDGVMKVDVVNFDKSPLFSDKIQIAQVKARRSRGRHNEYDYLIFRKNN